MQLLIGYVEELVDDSVLNQGQGKSLLAKLRQALQGLDEANTKAAPNILGAFINEVQALMNAGILTPAQGDALVAPAQKAIDQLSG